jgi:eukaryotic-like serine/threonine-protein kinase
MQTLEQHTRLGRFDLERTLGEGGMGVVYLAYDREQKRRVALKTLARVDPASRYRFKKEFRALADVSHPNLVVLHELIVSGETWFFTMEYVDGTDFLAHVCDLRAMERVAASTTEPLGSDGVLPAPPPTESQVVAVHSLRRSPVVNEARLREALRQLAEGIAALHGAGKLHRDIKPSNVLVTRDGRVVLLDFGMIDESQERTDVTLDEHLFGTPAYMSPEQAAGETATEASDWYGFGALLYETLTGRIPIEGTVLEILLRKQKEDPPRPSALVSHVPEDLEALCMSLLARTPRARPSGAEVLARLRDGGERTERASGPERRVSAPLGFVGRQAELEALQGAFEATRQGKPSVVLLGGASGLGKSALVRRFCDELRRKQGAVVLAGRCYERESLPFKAIDSVIDALCRHLARMPEAEASQLLPRNVRALARLFPVLRQVKVIENARFRIQEVPDPQELRRRGIAALKELLARMSDQAPIVISIDDAHWGDDDSALLLEHLLRAPDAPALLVIACHRPEVRSGVVLDQLRTIAKTEDGLCLTDIQLAALPPIDAERLAQDELATLGGASPDDARRIAVEAEGSPFFIGQLVLAWKRALTMSSSSRPQLSLDDVLAERIALLSPQARRLLEVVAVAGRPVDRTAAFVAAEGGEQAFADLDVLRAGHFVGTQGTREQDALECYHDRVRRAVLAHIAPDALSAVHLRLGDALERSVHYEPDATANHFFLAGAAERATRHALVAAADAAEALAFDRAAALYERVLESGVVESASRAEVLAKCAAALAHAGRSAAAARRYQEAAVVAAQGAAFEYRRMAAEHYLRSGRVEEGVSVLSEVLAARSLRLPRTPRTALLALLWGRARLSLRGLRYTECAEKDVPSELIARIDTCWSASVGLGLIDFVRGGDMQTQHCLLALRAGEPHRLARALALEAGYLAAEGGKAEQRVSEVLTLAEAILARHEDPHALGLTKLARGMATLHLGQFQESLAPLSESERVFRERCKGVAWEIATTHIFEATALYYLGELRTLSERTPAYLREAIERGDFYAASDLQTGVHVVPRLCADDVDGARALLAEEKGRWSKDGFHLQHWNQLLGETLADLYTGDGVEAYARVRERWPALQRSLVLQVQLIHVEARMLRACAALAASAQGREPDRRALSQALADARAIEGLQRPWATPLAKLVVGLCAKQQGQRADAVSALRAAEQGFVECRMSLHACAARAHLAQLLGPNEGRALSDQALSDLVDRGARRPERLVAMIAPGLG